jgi:hypothetical protein
MERYREEGLSAPRKDRMCVEEVGCPLVLVRPPRAGRFLDRDRTPVRDFLCPQSQLRRGI